MNTDSISLQFGPVSSAAPGALYEQIISAVKREIDAGRLEAGDTLPSVRALAVALQVSVITVTRAYEELERAGIIKRRQGHGTFVADSATDYSERLKRDAALAKLRDLIDAGRDGALSSETLEILRARLKFELYERDAE